jgi:hypothetical protein
MLTDWQYLWLIVAGVAATVCWVVADSRRLPHPGLWWLLGAALPPLGILAVLLYQPALASRASGWSSG